MNTDPFFTSDIKAICLDVDGVLTDGNLLITEEGKLLRTMNAKDGFAMRYMMDRNFPMAIITGGKSAGVVKRLEGLGIDGVFSGIQDKLPIFREWCKSAGIDESSVLYVGDDIPDIKIMQHCGYAACPQDAVPEVKAICGYVSPFGGGAGCIRDICRQLMQAHGVWVS